jgi:hypothetical protein
MGKYTIIFIVVVIIGFAVNGNIVVTAQSNSTNSDKQKIFVMWLGTNNTKTDTPVISVSDEDFWAVFGTLLKPSINGSVDASKIDNLVN